MGRLPMYSAPISCSTGISSGKLKGVITATLPKGNLCASARQGDTRHADRRGKDLKPLERWPARSPVTLKPCARNRTCIHAPHAHHQTQSTTQPRTTVMDSGLTGSSAREGESEYIHTYTHIHMYTRTRVHACAHGHTPGRR